MLEFTMLTPVWLGMLLGTMWIGTSLLRGLEVTQVARDSASLYSRGQDFTPAAYPNSSSSANNILPMLAMAVGTVTNTGSGVITFSTVTYVGNSVCALAGFGVAGNNTPSNTGSHTAACTNYGYFVFTQQYQVGNTGWRASNFGTPLAADMEPLSQQLQIPILNYTQHTGDRAWTNGTTPFNLLPIPKEDGTDGYQSGQPVYIAEAFFTGTAAPGYTTGGTYAYAIF